MTRVRIMYWKEIPVQVQAQDDTGTVSKQLDPRFQQGVDAVAMFDGSAGTDDYLMAWEWGEYQDIEGSAEAAADEMAQKFNSRFPEDFVARIRDLQREERRDPTPGALDYWLNSESM